MPDLNVQVLHRPIHPKFYPEVADLLCPELVAQYKVIFPDARPDKRDYEDWAENTLMMLAMRDAAAKADVPFMVLDNTTKYRLLGTGSHVPYNSAGAPLTAMWGAFNSGDPIRFPVPVRLVGNGRGNTTLVSLYAQEQTFLSRAGRYVSVIDMDLNALRQTLDHLQQQGHTQAFVKTTSKSWTALLDIHEDIPEDIKWDIVAHEGAENELCVQSVIDPTYEYRFFIVGEKVLTGAGCVELLTPLDHYQDGAFDTQVELVRNNGNIIEKPDLLDRYLPFAQQFAKDWAFSVACDTAYTLDVCIDRNTDTVVPIELNPMTNTGLYACVPSLIADALVQQCVEDALAEDAELASS